MQQKLKESLPSSRIELYLRCKGVGFRYWQRTSEQSLSFYTWGPTKDSVPSFDTDQTWPPILSPVSSRKGKDIPSFNSTRRSSSRLASSMCPWLAISMGRDHIGMIHPWESRCTASCQTACVSFFPSAANLIWIRPQERPAACCTIKVVFMIPVPLSNGR